MEMKIEIDNDASFMLPSRPYHLALLDVAVYLPYGVSSKAPHTGSTCLQEPWNSACMSKDHLRYELEGISCILYNIRILGIDAPCINFLPKVY